MSPVARARSRLFSGELLGVVLRASHLDPGELREGRALELRVVELARSGEALFEERLRLVVVGLADRRIAGRKVSPRQHPVLDVRRGRERLGEPLAPFGHVAARAPEAAERGRDAKADLDLARLERPLESRPQVPLLLVQALQPGRLLGPDQLGLGHLREREVALGVGALHRFGLAGFGEPGARVLTDRLEEDEAGLAVGIVDLAERGSCRRASRGDPSPRRAAAPPELRTRPRPPRASSRR